MEKLEEPTGQKPLTAATRLRSRTGKERVIADRDATRPRPKSESAPPGIAAALLAPISLPRPDHPDVGVGTVLSGRYRLEELLGEGGMGVVYRAADLQMVGVRVAIKLLKSDLRRHPDLLNVLRESVRKVRSIPHPNIASVYSLESDGTDDFVIMELLQGQTLKTLLDQEYARGVPIGLARTLIADLCSALAYAHDHGVIHSDLKPANIFVTPSGRAKLFDFDIARVLRGPVGYFDANQVGAMTDAYATVEMEHGAVPDPRDDVYALACVIYEMLSGRHPFGGASAARAKEQALTVKALPMLSRRENAALAKALQFEREQRLGSVEALRAAFSHLSASRPPSAPSRALRWWPAGLAAGLMLAATALWLFARAKPPRAPPLVARAAAELDRARSLAQRASDLSVDTQETMLRQAMLLMAALRTNEDPARLLREAQAISTALTAALAQAPRVAHLGTPDAQARQALMLCQQLNFAAHCSMNDIADESPRMVSLRPFIIDPTPVTNRDFARFVRASSRRTLAERKGILYEPDPDHGWVTVRRGQNWRTLRAQAAARGEVPDTLPVLGVDIDSARAYCAWRGGARLPTEDEWEYSARGLAGRIFPWGNQPTAPIPLPSHVVSVAPATVANSLVGRMGGNVAEWTESRLKGQYVMRGGSYLLTQPYFQRLALRRTALAEGATDAGFRCAVSTDHWAD